MLPSLWIRNFRALEDFRVPQLGRVNLIVGKNNSGKSTILEALRIYAQHASQTLLDEIVIAHDEVLRSLSQATSAVAEDEQIPYQNFFTGRNFPSNDGVGIYIGDEGETDFIRIAHTYYLEERAAVDSPEGGIILKRLPVSKSELHDDARQALLISSSRREQPKWIPISQDLPPDPRRYRFRTPDMQSTPVGFVPTGVLPSARLADLWDSIALTHYDEVVRDGLRIIEPRVDGVAFVKRELPRVRNDEERAAIIKLAGHERPVALNSMGDGMVRVLQLLLALVPAKNGLYLVDEFENGLHYSVQEKVWRLVFELAEANNVQVFAATHSWDCVEAFKNVAAAASQPAVLFRVGKSVKTSDKGKAIATVFDRDALRQLTQADVEVR